MRESVAACLRSLEARPGGLSARFLFPPDLDVFAAHFPGHPLVPGVFLIEAVRCAVARHLGRSVPILAVESAKFSAEVPPGAELDLEVALETLEGGIRCQATAVLGSETAAKIRLRLGA